MFYFDLAARHVRENRVSETHGDSISPVRQLGEPITVRQFPSSALRLLRNPAFMCVTLGHAFSGLVTIALATFIPKYLQNMFHLTAARSAMLSGKCPKSRRQNLRHKIYIYKKCCLFLQAIS